MDRDALEPFDFDFDSWEEDPTMPVSVDRTQPVDYAAHRARFWTTAAGWVAAGYDSLREVLENARLADAAYYDLVFAGEAPVPATILAPAYNAMSRTAAIAAVDAFARTVAVARAFHGDLDHALETLELLETGLIDVSR